MEFGSEDTKTRPGVKYKVKLPESKNYRDCLVPYIDKEVIMGIRPEHVHDEDMYLDTMSDGIVEATVEVTELMGAETYLYMNCEGRASTPAWILRPCPSRRRHQDRSGSQQDSYFRQGYREDHHQLILSVQKKRPPQGGRFCCNGTGSI